MKTIIKPLEERINNYREIVKTRKTYNPVMIQVSKRLSIEMDTNDYTLKSLLEEKKEELLKEVKMLSVICR